jgi:hypothetical protein
MGRSSRRKQQRRDDPVWQGLKAEARGRRMPALLETYERALATRGIEGMKEGLYSRNNQRWANIQQHGPQLAAQVMPVLGPSGVIQLLAEKIGANRGRLPASPYGSPIDHLAWGIDGVTSACRMLLLGQAFGAAVLARTQLERWTFNLAHGLGVEFAFGDLGKANMCTLWDVHHLHVDIAETWNELSELLHGRGKYLTVGHWEAVDIMHGDVPSALADLAKSLGPILAQLRSVALGQAAEKQMATATHLLRGWPESTAYEAPVDFPSSAMSTAGLRISLSSLWWHPRLPACVRQETGSSTRAKHCSPPLNYRASCSPIIDTGHGTRRPEGLEQKRLKLVRCSTRA